MISIMVLSLILSITTEPNWSSESEHYQASEFIEFRSDPSTWAADGAVGLRWGMGPGDVRAVVPDLKFVFANASMASGQSGHVDETIGGLEVTTGFRFLRGRLYAVDISPAVLPNVDISADGLERFWEKCWKWRKSIQAIFEDRLGKPACAPTSRTIIRLHDFRPPSRFGNEDAEDRKRLLRWVWREGRTETLLTGGGAPQLRYSDTSALAGVEVAMQQASAARADRLARGKEAESRKLTGGRNAQDLSPKSSEQAPSQATGASQVLAPIQCVTDDDEPSAEVRTAQSTWSKVGWERLRWGMGPKDVMARLTVSQATAATWDPGVMSRASILLPSERAFGAAVSTKFTFSDGRLAGAIHRRDCSAAPAAPAAECIAWSRRVESAFDKKCGLARCTRDGKYIECAWDCGVAESPSLIRYDSGNFQDVTLAYEDPANVQRKADTKVLRTTTPESSWAKQGWFGFQWAMGLADVQRRLMAPKGEFQSNRELWCVVGRSDAFDTDCTLERDFHEFSIAGLKPTLRFSFLGGRLRHVSLIFPKHLEQETFEAASGNLKELLIARYGQPRATESSRRNTKNSTSLDWALEDLSVSLEASKIGSDATLFVSYFSELSRQWPKARSLSEPSKL